MLWKRVYLESVQVSEVGNNWRAVVKTTRCPENRSPRWWSTQLYFHLLSAFILYSWQHSGYNSTYFC